MQHLFLYFLYCFTLAFTSADIFFYNFLELDPTLYLKKDFCHEFYFFNGFTQTLHPQPHKLNDQNPLAHNRNKSFW